VRHAGLGTGTRSGRRHRNRRSRARAAAEETIYGLEGVLTWTIEGIQVDVSSGETVVIPRGAVHRFENTGHLDAKALGIVTPGILGAAYFREVAAVLDAAAGAPPDLGAVGDVMRRHGLTPAWPPSRARLGAVSYRCARLLRIDVV
jgi:hypothetical protein